MARSALIRTSTLAVTWLVVACAWAGASSASQAASRPAGQTGSQAASRPASRTAAAPGQGPATRCAAPGPRLRGTGGQWARVRVCVTVDGSAVTVSAPAECHTRRGTARPVSCVSTGTWRMARTGRRATAGQRVTAGTLGSRAAYPGPGGWTVTGTVRVVSSPAGMDLRGRAAAAFRLTAPLPRPARRVTVSAPALRPGRTVTARYTVTSSAADGDDSARLGLIGRAGTGVRVTSADPWCGNPLVGAYPSTARRMWTLDCSLTGIQPGRPRVVTVRITAGRACSTVVSKLGFWTPRGQDVTGQMINGPTLGCAAGR
jgi:hypothetical protein